MVIRWLAGTANLSSATRGNGSPVSGLCRVPASCDPLLPVRRQRPCREHDPVGQPVQHRKRERVRPVEQGAVQRVRERCTGRGHREDSVTHLGEPSRVLRRKEQFPDACRDRVPPRHPVVAAAAEPGDHYQVAQQQPVPVVPDGEQGIRVAPDVAWRTRRGCRSPISCKVRPPAAQGRCRSSTWSSELQQAELPGAGRPVAARCRATLSANISPSLGPRPRRPPPACMASSGELRHTSSTRPTAAALTMVPSSGPMPSRSHSGHCDSTNAARSARRPAASPGSLAAASPVSRVLPRSCIHPRSKALHRTRTEPVEHCRPQPDRASGRPCQNTVRSNGQEAGRTVHDIISDIIDWDQANKAYTAGEGQSGERYIQRLEAADRMATIEARWQHLPKGSTASGS